MTDYQDPPPRDGQSLSLAAYVESLLFVADEPVHEQRLAAVLETSPEEIERALQELADGCAGRGLRIQRKDHHVQMVTAPEAAIFVRRQLGVEVTAKLSTAALETLAVVAYRQPVTRAQVEAIRGVSSDSVLRTLVNHGLVEEQGRLDQAGRPIIYGTTFSFLQEFGLSDLSRLPPLTPAVPQPEPAAQAERGDE